MGSEVPSPFLSVSIRVIRGLYFKYLWLGFGRFGAGHRDVFEHIEQGLMALGQVADLGRPVVHLGVDVDGLTLEDGFDFSPTLFTQMTA